VTVEHASAKAIEKIEAAGGSVTLSGDDDNEWEED
jgi:ribosomal protein L15